MYQLIFVCPSLATVLFFISTILSYVSVRHARYRPEIPVNGRMAVYVLPLLNTVYSVLSADSIPFLVRYVLEKLILWTPILLLLFLCFHAYLPVRLEKVWVIVIIAILFSIYFHSFDQNLHVISVVLYGFVLPLWLSYALIPSDWNLLNYFSLWLPAVYFTFGWFWYAERAFLKDKFYNGNVIQEVFPKMITVILMLIVFTTLGVRTLGSRFFRLNVDGSRLGKTILLCVPFFLLTLILVTMAVGVFYTYPQSLDRNEWIETHSGLSVQDQLMSQNIQRIELDNTECARYHTADQQLNDLIKKYRDKREQHGHRSQSFARKLNKTLSDLHFQRGLLKYRCGNLDRAAYRDFTNALMWNPNNTRAEFYTIITLNKIERHDDSLALAEKFIEKYAKAEETNTDSTITMLTHYYLMVIHHYVKHAKQKPLRRRKTNKPPPFVFNKGWPSHKILAELSDLAYCQERWPENWKRLEIYDDTHNTGYFGIAVQNTETDFIAIAHRGTHLQVNIASLLADYDLYRRKVPEMVVLARKFTTKIRKERMKSNSNNILWHTGHSLGGAIAELLVANETLFRLKVKSFAVTFDSPGIMEIVDQYHYDANLSYPLPEPHEFPIISYLSAPNIINTMGTHTGLVLRLFPAPLAPQAFHPILQTIYSLSMNIKFLAKLEPITAFLLNQVNEELHWHSLRTIIECFELWPDEKTLPSMVVPVIKWPKGPRDLVLVRDLAVEHNLMRLEIIRNHRKSGNLAPEHVIQEQWYVKKKRQLLASARRYNYHVVDPYEQSVLSLPFQLLSTQTQKLLKAVAPYLGRVFSLEATLIFLPTCNLFTTLDSNTTQLLFDVLYWDPPYKQSKFVPNENFFEQKNMIMIAVNESAVPIYNQQVYRMNILTIYTLLSLVDVDTCIQPTSRPFYEPLLVAFGNVWKKIYIVNF